MHVVPVILPERVSLNKSTITHIYKWSRWLYYLIVMNYPSLVHSGIDLISTNQAYVLTVVYLYEYVVF